MPRLDGKTAIVTGAAQGIGLAIAQCFVAEGARVALTDINEGKGRAAADALRNAGADVVFEPLDVADKASAEQATARIASTFGPPTVLVNNAGIAVFRDPLETSADDWQRCFSVDLDGVWACTQAALPYMLEAGAGDVVNIASVHAFQIIPGCFPYPIAKHAVVGLTRALAIEYASRDIRVNAIAPGYIGTEIVEKVFRQDANPEEARRRTDALHPVGRIGRPEEIGWAAVFLASDEARFLTGQTLIIDGGRSIQFHE